MSNKCINENDFYKTGEQEHFYNTKIRVNIQSTNNSSDDYDELLFVDNSNPFYIRLGKKRGNSFMPCGGMDVPASIWIGMSEKERDKSCPKIAWGFSAYILSKTKEDETIKDYKLTEDVATIYNKYYNIWKKIYMYEHSGFKFAKLTEEEKERNFLFEHIKKEKILLDKSKGLKKYGQLYDIAEFYYDKYVSYLSDKPWVENIKLKTKQESKKEECKANTTSETNKPKDTVKKNFTYIIQDNNKPRLLKRLHSLIDGKRGADVGAILLKAYLDGYLMRVPTQAEYESEFNLIGSWEAIRKYLDKESNNAILKVQGISIFP